MYLRTECFCCMPTTIFLSGKVDLLEKLLDNFPKKKRKKVFIYFKTKKGQVATCPYDLKKTIENAEIIGSIWACPNDNGASSIASFEKNF